jgi:flagellar hook assembly protein FlgD
LNYDFNRIEWDGRDEDGSLIANGVYLYKVIVKKGSDVITATQKLAVVR